MRRHLLFAAFFTTFLLSPSVAHGLAGSSCPKIGTTKTVRGVAYTCKKSGKRKVWRKVRKADSGLAANLTSLRVKQTVGAVRTGAGSGNGPWAMRAVLRTSTDGVNFTGSETIMDQAGVPNLLTTSNGSLFAYYQDWANGNIMGVAVKRSGATAWEHFRVSISGINTTANPNGVDPSAIELSDGRIRLFWMQRLGGNRIFSATSTTGETNGIVFKYDGGVAFDAAGEIFDPTVVQTSAGWSLWADVQGTTAYATSTNGLTFIAQPSNSAFSRTTIFPWGATRTPSGEIRVIASDRGPGGSDGIILRSVDGGSTFTEIGRNAIPSTAGGDTGISYDPVKGLWYQLVSERM